MQPTTRGAIHHLGVQTADLDNCLNWYLEFFGAEKRWELDRFSALTLSRLPDIRRLIEVAAGGLRFHLFDRTGPDGGVPREQGIVQHACIEAGTPEELVRLRDRWIELYASGRFTFARTDGPTDIVEDADGVLSLYLLDVNGFEYEFTYVPEGSGR